MQGEAEEQGREVKELKNVPLSSFAFPLIERESIEAIKDCLPIYVYYCIYH